MIKQYHVDGCPTALGDHEAIPPCPSGQHRWRDGCPAAIVISAANPAGPRCSAHPLPAVLPEEARLSLPSGPVPRGPWCGTVRDNR